MLQIEPAALIFSFITARIVILKPPLFLIVINIEPYGLGLAVKARSMARRSHILRYCGNNDVSKGHFHVLWEYPSSTSGYWLLQQATLSEIRRKGRTLLLPRTLYEKHAKTPKRYRPSDLLNVFYGSRLCENACAVLKSALLRKICQCFG